MIQYLCAISASSSFQTLIKHLDIFFRLKYQFFNKNISYHFPHVTCFWLTSTMKVFSSCNLWGVRIWLSELWQLTKYKTRTTIVVSNGRYTFYQIPFIEYHLSNTIYQIPFIKYLLIKYHLSNTIYQILFAVKKIFFNQWMNQSINRVLLEWHICH